MAVGLAAAAFSGCAHNHRVRAVGPVQPARGVPSAAPSPRHLERRPAPPPGPAAVGYTETGLASWYGHPYHGRKAADGETYDMETLVAAHRTLPFNTWVRVVNLNSGKSVDVRIIDRGPFVGGRIIDLSHAAAQAIDLVGPGVGPVRLEVIRLAENAPPGAFGVQVGAFRNRDNAERLRQAMQTRYGSARLVQRADTPGFWHVVVGREPTQEDASALSRRICLENSSIHLALVVRIDNI